MSDFAGFPAGKLRFTSIPDLFFSQLLPEIEDLAELKVILHLFWLLHDRPGGAPCASWQELASDGVFLEGLGGEEALRRGLDKAVERGVLVRVAGQEREWYFLNDQRGRRAVERVREGRVKLEGVPLSYACGPSPERPNIFTLYEQNIGLLQPIIAEELAQAEKEYPPEWIEEAFRLAAERNVRRWRYIRGILERWAAQGRGDGKLTGDTEEERRRRLLGGKYADYIKH